jgi:arsenite methyltransferase
LRRSPWKRRGIVTSAIGAVTSRRRQRKMVSHAHDNPELARTYDRLSDQQFEGGQRLARLLHLVRGDRVLDIGCGTGRLAEWMASQFGPEVVGIDPLPERVALARARAPGLRFEVGRAEDLGAVPAGSFDAVCVSAAFHWIEGKPRAVAEMARVLCQGGRLGLTTLGKELQGQGTLTTVLRSVVAGPPFAAHARQAASSLRAATLTEIVTLVGDAALTLRELHVVRRERRYRTGEDVVSFFESSSFGNLLGSFPEEVRPRLRSDLVDAFEARRGDAGIPIVDHGVILVADKGA